MDTGLYSSLQRYTSSQRSKSGGLTRMRLVSSQQILSSVMTNIIVYWSTDHAKPLSLCLLPQYRRQIKRFFQFVTQIVTVLLSTTANWPIRFDITASCVSWESFWDSGQQGWKSQRTAKSFYVVSVCFFVAWWELCIGKDLLTWSWE